MSTLLEKVEGSYIPRYNVHLSDIGCKYMYCSMIPTFNEAGPSVLIRGIIDFLTAIAIILFVWYKSRRSIYLLPFYKKVLWIYVGAAVISSTFHIIKYYVPDDAGNNGEHGDEKAFGIVIMRVIHSGTICAIQILVLMIIIQNSTISTKVLIRSIIAASFVGIIVGTLKLCQHFFGYLPKRFTVDCIIGILNYCLLPFVIVIFVFFGVRSAVNNEKSDLMQRRKLLIYVYSFCLCATMSFAISARIFLLFRIDGYCLASIACYLFRIIFPFLLIYTMRTDNLIWTDYMDAMKGIFAEIRQKGTSEQQKLINRKNSMGGLAVDLLRTKCHIFRLSQLEGLSCGILGTGGKALVRKCKLGNEIVAVKELHYDGNEQFSPEEKIRNMAEYINEVWTVSSMKHPNIVRLKGVCLDDKRIRGHFYLIYEHSNRGDLKKFLQLDNHQRQSHISFRIRLKLLLDVAKGMSFLHSENVVHRDLDPQNILVHYDEEKSKYIAKVCDFGDCKNVQMYGNNKQSYNYMSIRGKSEYRDPAYDEVKENKMFRTNADELRAVDVWAFRKIILEVWCCVIVRKKDIGCNMVMASFQENDFNGDQDSYDQFTTLISDCLQIDKLKRPSFKEIIHTLENVIADLDEDISHSM